VDAERVAELLDVTARTARRTLRTLVDEGLAWPVPPARTTGAGRPRQLYRLVTTKLTRDL
jgi:predicted ArsR family transcriptional regulator